ncbi:MAG TPA: DUF72 domain-containing protein [Acetobacteraceae bacterium]|nr:DUF72 domain-containing protein [Acetobacteraceae bacterium]
MAGPLRIGTAGWSIPTEFAADFPGQGTHLERYAKRFNAVEINSSFYRPHRRTTYERWADSVPADFRFSVKLPKSLTHERRLKDGEDLVERFAGEVEGLGEKFGVLLIQLPPSLAFSDEAGDFLRRLRPRFAAALALEPRHKSWFMPAVEEFLTESGIARVAADPPRFAGGDEPAGCRKTAYFRLHGSPRIYYSRYDEAALADWSRKASHAVKTGAQAWVIFDNTAEGAAIDNAAEMITGRYGG